MSNASSVAPRLSRTSAAAITTMLVVGLLLPACGSVRGTGKPLLEKERGDGKESTAASASGPAASTSSAETSTAPTTAR